MTTTRETNTCSERSTSGLICQNCELVATCILRNDEWLTVPVDTCNVDEGYFCNLRYGGCSNETGPCRSFGYEGNFVCTSEGVFPDPYDCQRYHMCYNAGTTLVAANVECGTNKAFSAATGDCSAHLNETICQQKQFNCSNAGDCQAWPGNRNVFYICKATLEHGNRILYPTMYRCAPGEVFNGKDCITNATTNNTLIQSQMELPFECIKSGLHPDPNDCKAYYYCDLFLREKHYTCPKSSHFDKKRKTCMRGVC